MNYIGKTVNHLQNKTYGRTMLQLQCVGERIHTQITLIFEMLQPDWH